jgi:hypothetical protein
LKIAFNERGLAMVNFFFATLNFILKILSFLALIFAGLAFYQIRYQAPDNVAADVTRIDTMRADPDKFDNRTVEIEGIVTSSYGIFSVGVFTMRDENGDKTISIVTTSGVPVVSDAGNEKKIKRTGLFRQTITLNKRQYPFVFVQAKTGE